MTQYKAIPIEQCPERLPIPASAKRSPWLVVRFEGDTPAEVLLGFDTGVEAALVASWLWREYLRGIDEGRHDV